LTPASRECGKEILGRVWLYVGIRQSRYRIVEDVEREGPGARSGRAFPDSVAKLELSQPDQTVCLAQPGKLRIRDGVRPVPSEIVFPMGAMRRRIGTQRVKLADHERWIVYFERPRVAHGSLLLDVIEPTIGLPIGGFGFARELLALRWVEVGGLRAGAQDGGVIAP
jgi:hypothetical protein